jgi:hypothetical protein
MKQLLFFMCVLLSSMHSFAVEITGKTEFEITVYKDNGQFLGQEYRHNFSVALEPEFYWSWNSDNDTLVFTPFVRVDEHDAERTHGDIRELSWVHVVGQWEFRSGIRKVFWGVTEFNHLVDIINQTDSVDSFDGEEKLGQAMFNLSRVTDWGILDVFVLPGFRERTFNGRDGRLRGQSIVASDNAIYESDREEKRVDYALRWSHSVGVFDLGLYRFNGTDRDPLLQLANGSSNQLVPFYQQIVQFGLDVQATIDSWLWKFEGIDKKSRSDSYLAAQFGFEYTLYGISDSATDLGVLLEYGWDERDLNASSVAQNDIYLGARLTLNDVNDSALLLGLGYDADYHTRNLLIEASRRINDYWMVTLEGLFFVSNNPMDPAAALVDDDRLQIKLERYF